MTLERVLGVRRDFLSAGEREGMLMAQIMWVEAGAPVDPPTLAVTLERILLKCTETAVTYPKILLRRKKELERGTWRPQQGAAQAYKPWAPTEPVKQDVKCQECQDRGYIPIGSGLTATLCKCQVPHAQPDPSQTQA